MTGKVYLVGAGPGDSKLITLRAVELIQKADVVLYDRLVSKKIISMIPKRTKSIYVGRAVGDDTKHQDGTNDLMVKYAKLNKIVVRLKGGDPIIFGRGGEEALYLKDRDVKFDIVPGITSAISVPAYAGIPVTQRGIVSSFRVITGHEAPGKAVSQIDWNSFNTDETLVFLMGLHNLGRISSKLMEAGKRKDYPVAVISQGTTPTQKVVIGTLENIKEKAKDLETPALIVVGEVVNLRDELKWFD